MATYIPFILFFVVFSTFFSAINSKFSEQSPQTITMKAIEKKTSLHFYFRDISSGKNQTSTAIARPLNMTAAANFFGSTSRADVLLREGPEPTSKLVGREQGIYAFASQHNAVLLMVMNSAVLLVERFHCCSNEILVFPCMFRMVLFPDVVSYKFLSYMKTHSYQLHYFLIL
jgi:hypothetical protein